MLAPNGIGMREQRRRTGGLFGRSRSGAEAASAQKRANGSPTVPPGAVPLEPLEPEIRAAPAETEPSAPRPPRPRIAGPLEAFLRHPVLTVLPLVLLLGGAAALAVQRDPEYTANSRISVGTTDVNPFLLQEVVAGNQALAATYARAIDTAPVITAASRATGIPPGTAADRLSATPVPGSTLIQVEATGPSEPASVRLANAGAQALIAYVRRINRSTEADELFKRYKQAQEDARLAERRTQRILQSSRRRSRAATEARIAQDVAVLRATDFAERYRAASASAANASRLTLIAPAADADSDRRDTIEQLLLVGAVGGLVLGLALALLATNWRILRALRQT